jgi:hypothetical protein
MMTIEQPTLPLPLPVLPGGDGAVRGGALETTGGPVGSTAGGNRKIFFPNGAPGLAKRLGGWWEAVESVAFACSETDYFARLELAEKEAAKIGISHDEFHRDMFRRDLYYLRRVALSEKWGETEDRLRWEYDKPGSDLAIDPRYPRQLWLEPRGWRKSSKLRAKMIQRVLRNPNIALLYQTGVLELATSGLAEIKGVFLENRYLRRYFPELCPKSDMENRCTFTSPGRTQTQVEPTITAASTNTNLTGRHYDEIYGDDWINEDNCTTRELVRQSVEALRLTFPLLRRHDGGMTVAGTRYDFADVYGHIIETMSREVGGDFFCVVQPAENDDGTAAVPAVATTEVLTQWRRDLGGQYSAQMLQRPQNEHQRITPDLFRYHADGEAEIKGAWLALLTDAAFSKREGADFVALVVCAVTPDNHWDVLEYTRDHLDPRAFLNRIWHYWDKYKPLGGLQRITVQSATLDQVLAFFLNEDMRTRDEYLPMHPVSVAGLDKVKRIERAVTRLRSERLRIRRDMPELEDEFLRFPKAPHDDLTDALSDLAVIAPMRAEKAAVPVTPKAPADFSFANMWRGLSDKAHAATGAVSPNQWVINPSAEQLLGRVPVAASSLN